MDSFSLNVILTAVARTYSIQLPMYIVWFVGLWYALRMMQRQQRGARAALWAVILQLTTSIIFSPLSLLVPWTLIRRGTDSSTSNMISLGLGFISSGISAVAWAIMLFVLLHSSQSQVVSQFRSVSNE